MGTFWNNVRLLWSHEAIFGETANVRNIAVSYIAGCLFAIGWWMIIDVAATYPSEAQFPHGYHALGAFTTLAIILLLWSRWDEEAFFGGPRVSRFIIFFGFFLGFFCVIASIWIMFQEYVVYKGRASSWPGVALFLQNSLIFSSGLVYKLGRTHDDYEAF